MKVSVKKAGNTIVSYWRKRQPKDAIAVTWDDAENHCWRCGRECTPQQCHIIPAALGGKNKPKNLVLLCETCHRENPNVPDPSFMWVWIKATKHDHKMRFEEEWSAIFHAMFGRHPFETLTACGGVTIEQIRECTLRRLRETVKHYGERNINAASYACCAAMIEKDLLNTGLATSRNSRLVDREETQV